MLGLAVVARAPEELSAALGGTGVGPADRRDRARARAVRDRRRGAGAGRGRTRDGRGVRRRRRVHVGSARDRRRRHAATGRASSSPCWIPASTVDHPDFAGRTVTTQSFITGEAAEDGHGHGTHCIGTAAGPAQPGEGRRYGIATGAEIFAGKVLSNAGSGADAGILAGIEWAITNGCRVISMSLGSDVREPSATYEAVGRRALDAGTLIVAAAGNNAQPPRRTRASSGSPPTASRSWPSARWTPTAARRLLGRQRHAGGRGGRHRRAGRRRLLVVAHAAALQHHLRHEHGDAARRRHRGAVVAGTGDTGEALWARVVGAAKALEHLATRRRRGAGAGAAAGPGAAADPGAAARRAAAG